MTEKVVADRPMPTRMPAESMNMNGVVDTAISATPAA
jgi:hypothetical protein